MDATEQIAETIRKDGHREHALLAKSNAIAWISLSIGALSGLFLGLWSFGGPIPVPEMIGDYDTLPRRLLRLGHIAFFGLGILNLLLARQVSLSSMSDASARQALMAMNFGNILLPLSLIAAAFFEPLKYFMSVPALSVAFALSTTARTAVRDAFGTAK